MSLPPNFLAQLVEKSDADVYEILTHKDDYLPEAVDAAKQEVEPRKLPSEQLAQLQADIDQRKAQEDKKVETKLAWYFKALIFIGLFPAIWFATYYEYTGHKRKARECWAWAGYSFVFWFIIGVLKALA